MTTASAPPAIRAFDYLEQFAEIRKEVLDAVAGVLDSGSLILGPQVRAFEEGFAEFLGARGEAVGVANGTDALAIALRAMGIGPGDDVITVANTAIPTVSAIRMAGARPVFCEIDPLSLLMDVEDARRRVTARTRAIIAVHLYGNAVDMGALMQLAKDANLAVIEDCAQSCGTTWRGQMTGTIGDVGCFSFYPTKNLGAYGDAGACFTRRPELATIIRETRVYGCDARSDAVREGVNSRLDELQAAILNVKLRHLSEYLTRRRQVARWYAKQLREDIMRPSVAAEVEHSYHLLVVAVEARDRLAARLTAKGIGYGIHYPTPIHRMRAYDFLGWPEGSLPHTEQAARRVLSLPCYPELRRDLVQRICSVVNDATAESF
jgi:dTDP-3-amino-2,3,6-trideoxy-4-keto-D-glucose/dTDP-3-amino-3,4,6-trideoxy-alpha-D-glucose/dTDP-2,6-dideoxy-D-kanosamine transaminase